MAVSFVTDVGFRLSTQGRSMILATMAFGKVGVELSNRQIVQFAGIADDYLSNISARAELPKASAKVMPAMAPPLAEDIAYKFTDDTAIRFWAEGSIRVVPPAVYKSIETASKRDLREGLGTVYLAGAERFAVMTSEAGFNAYVLCTSSDARRTERPERHRRFGNRLIKIHGATEFASKLAARIGAARFTIRDVTYSDTAVVRAKSNHISEWVKYNGIGDLRPEFLEYIALRHLDELVSVTLPASIFCKPTFYRLERERRFLFEMPMDVSEAINVRDKSLAAHIEIVH